MIEHYIQFLERQLSSMSKSDQALMMQDIKLALDKLNNWFEQKGKHHEKINA
jgi:hypothetical protein